MPNEVVEAAGYPSLLNGRAILSDTLFRRTGEVRTNLPTTVSGGEVFGRDLDGELVCLRGKLLQNTVRGGDHLLIMDSDGLSIETTLPKPAAGGLEVIRIRPGSFLEVTGVAKVSGVREWTGHVRLSAFSLALRSVGDIRVLQQPSWWTAGRLLGLVGVLAAAIALVLLWGFALRRRVATQTFIIRQNLEKEAIWEERSRIARDLHDDVGASLTQISLLCEMTQLGGPALERVQGQMRKITTKARDAVRALDEIVWTVNPRNDSLAFTASYLCHSVQDVMEETGIRCRLRVPEDFPAGTLGAKTRHHLFLATKEAVGNVMKHSGADELQLELSVAGQALKVSVADNGHGFDLANANPNRSGLGNMERRLANVGGNFQIESRPGAGTRVTFTVPFATHNT
jgi:signal transduction histidine kinase